MKTAISQLNEVQIKSLQDAQDKITIEMLEGLDYGEEIELNDTITLYRYCEDDIIVLNITESWIEVLQVTWNTEIEYEIL